MGGIGGFRTQQQQEWRGLYRDPGSSSVRNRGGHRTETCGCYRVTPSPLETSQLATRATEKLKQVILGPLRCVGETRWAEGWGWGCRQIWALGAHPLQGTPGTGAQPLLNGLLLPLGGTGSGTLRRAPSPPQHGCCCLGVPMGGRAGRAGGIRLRPWNLRRAPTRPWDRGAASRHLCSSPPGAPRDLTSSCCSVPQGLLQPESSVCP